MCGSMVHIQSPTAEIRPGKKIEERTHRAKIKCPHLLRRAAIKRIKLITRHTASTEHSLTFRVRNMLSYREVEASLLVGWSLASLFSTNTAISETKASYYNYGSRYVAIATQPMH